MVIDYLNDAGPDAAISKSCNFNLVGYGCTTCIGNSGPLPEDVAAAVQQGQADGRRRAFAAIAISKAASIRWCARTIWRRRRWWWRTRWPAAWISISRTSRSGKDQQRPRRLSCRTSGRRTEEVQAAVKKIGAPRDVPQGILGSVRGDARWNSIKVPDGRSLCVGRSVHLHQARRRISTTWSIRRRIVKDLSRPARAGDAGRFGHHRSHFARRQYRRWTAPPANI